MSQHHGARAILRMRVADAPAVNDGTVGIDTLVVALDEIPAHSYYGLTLLDPEGAQRTIAVHRCDCTGEQLYCIAYGSGKDGDDENNLGFSENQIPTFYAFLGALGITNAARFHFVAESEFADA